MGADGRWKMENELSLPMSEFIFLEHFSQLTNCYIILKHSKLRAMTPGNASQITPVQITHILCYGVLYKLSMCEFDSCSICVEQHNRTKMRKAASH